MSSRRLLRVVIIASLAFSPFSCALAEGEKTKSFHAGFLHPNGVDVLGVSSERQISDKVYQFYNFGLPSFAAIGVNYYENYRGSGLNVTAGVGVGSIAYASIACQFSINKIHYAKFGTGYTTGIAYSGLYPIAAFEFRFGDQ